MTDDGWLEGQRGAFRETAILCTDEPKLVPQRPGELLLVGRSVVIGAELWDDPLIQLGACAFIRRQVIDNLDSQVAADGLRVQMHVMKVSFTTDPEVVDAYPNDGCPVCVAGQAAAVGAVRAGKWAVLCTVDYDTVAA